MLKYILLITLIFSHLANAGYQIEEVGLEALPIKTVKKISRLSEEDKNNIFFARYTEINDDYVSIDLPYGKANYSLIKEGKRRFVYKSAYDEKLIFTMKKGKLRGVFELIGSSYEFVQIKGTDVLQINLLQISAETENDVMDMCPDEGDWITICGIEGIPSPPPPAEESSGYYTPRPSKPHDVSIMVVYTKEAQEYYNNLYTSGSVEMISRAETRIKRLQDYTEYSDANGWVNFVLADVHMWEETEEWFTYNTVGNQKYLAYSSLLRSASANRYISRPTLHWRRGEVDADIVAVIVRDIHNNSGVCGKAMGIEPNSTKAYFAVRVGCFNETAKTFSHEVGHIFGAVHNPEAQDFWEDNFGDEPYSFAHGYRLNSVGERTIMSYDCSSGCTRAEHFSNPNINFKRTGLAAGTDGRHDVSRVLRKNAEKISKYR